MSSGHLSMSPSLSFPNRSLHFRSKTLTRSNITKSHVVFASINITKLSEAECIPISKEPGELDRRIPVGAGVYGVYDSNGDLQFVGTSRSVSMSVNKHRRWVSELCSSVKVGPVGRVGLASWAKTDWADLKSAWQEWMGEHMMKTGNPPPGNTSESDSWIVPPPRLRLSFPGSEAVGKVIERVLRVHETVVFIYGPITKVLKGPEIEVLKEYNASVRLVGILLKHGVDFVTVDLLDSEGNVGVRKELEGSFNVKEIPMVFVKGELFGGEEAVFDLAEKCKLHTVFQD